MSATAWALLFALGAVVLARAGVVLARAGDQIAERTGLSRLAVGAVLVAFATSLPEVLTDVSAAIADAPDVAVGDLFGSSMANMAILAVVDLSHRGRVWLRVELGHARVAAVAIGLTALATLAVLTPPGVSFGWVGLDTVAVAGAYLAAIAWIRRSPGPHLRAGDVLPTPTGWADRSEEVEGPAPDLGAGDEHGSVRPALLRFGGGALLVAMAAPVVALSGREIAATTGVEETVVGVGLVAISTSLPELVASLAAVRIGAHDLAVGNLFGSNAANMAVLVIVDAAYSKGPLLAAVDPSQTVAAAGAIILMALALAAIVHGEETRLHRLEPDAVLLLIAYVGCLVAVWAGQP